MGACYSFLPCSPQFPPCAPQCRRAVRAASRTLCVDASTEGSVAGRKLSPREKCGCRKLQSRELLRELESVLYDKEQLERSARSLFESCCPPHPVDCPADAETSFPHSPPHTAHTAVPRTARTPLPHKTSVGALSTSPSHASHAPLIPLLQLPAPPFPATITAATTTLRAAQCDVLRDDALRYIHQSHPCILVSSSFTPQEDLCADVPLSPASEQAPGVLPGVACSRGPLKHSSHGGCEAGEDVPARRSAKRKREDSDYETNSDSHSAWSSSVVRQSTGISQCQQSEHTRHVASIANNICTYLLKAASRSSKPMSFASFVRLYQVVLTRTSYALGGDGFARQMFLSSTFHKTIWDAGYRKIKVLGEGSFGIVYLSHEPFEPSVSSPSSHLRQMSKMTLEDRMSTCTTHACSSLWAQPATYNSSAWTPLSSFSSFSSLASTKYTAIRPDAVTILPEDKGPENNDDTPPSEKGVSLSRRTDRMHELRSCLDRLTYGSEYPFIRDEELPPKGQGDGDAAAGAAGAAGSVTCEGQDQVGCDATRMGEALSVDEHASTAEDEGVFPEQLPSIDSRLTRRISFRNWTSTRSPNTFDSTRTVDLFLEELSVQALKQYGGRHVVVKEIKKQSTKNVLPADAIKEEIVTLLRMDHPHVIRIFAAYEDTDYLYIVLDFARGGELQHIIENSNRKKVCIAVPFIQKVMKQILSAVAYCHHMMIIHKDLKASNIMLLNDCDPTRQDGTQSDPHAVVIDFGFAEMFSVEGKNQRLTGTPHSMAPETWRGFLKVHDVAIGPLVDTWGCGCILFELFTGKHPFSVYNVNPRSWLKAISKGPRMQLLSRCCDRARDLVKSMLEVDVSKRPSAAACLRHAWFATVATSSTSIDSDSSDVNQVVLRLLAYQQHDIAFKTFLMSIASQVSPNEVPEINALFREIDVDKDGVLHRKDFVAALQGAGVPADAAEQCFDCLDWSGDGVVQYTEFVAALLSEENFSAELPLWKSME
eukprot:GEMP01001111.1.p1 GENE.GEMP01001111.1~~GEMP01001111.1.p1  ORF type:complete len:993 (+),score=255.32 GEMP01001111.1:232-3210(+)